MERSLRTIAFLNQVNIINQVVNDFPTNIPYSKRKETCPFSNIKITFIKCFHESNISLIDNIKKGISTNIHLCNFKDESLITKNKFISCLFIALFHFNEKFNLFVRGKNRIFLNLPQISVNCVSSVDNNIFLYA